jgi:hypothetical protein
MNKEAALAAMRRGEKVTHEYFCRGEWMTFAGDLIVFEDGVSCTEQEFWDDRDYHGWDSGYSIWQGGE